MRRTSAICRLQENLRFIYEGGTVQYFHKIWFTHETS
jgi:hypothetical protein